MKTKLFVIAGLLVIAACLVVSIVVSKDRHSVSDINHDSAVKSLRSEMKLHDSVNATAIANAGDVIQAQNQKIYTLCNQIKAAKLVQPLCQ